MSATSKPTPGPWRNARADLLITSVSGVEVCDANMSAPYGPTSEQVANARLIAATPDMADILLDALEYFEAREDVNDGSDGRPVPNVAMSYAMRIRDVLAQAGIKS